MTPSLQIKSLAASLGFDACGIVRAEPSPDDTARLRQWVAEGSHGEMKYMEDFESRAKKFWENFPEARSIIVVGVNYYSRRPVIARPGLSSHCETATQTRSKQSPSLEIALPAGRQASSSRSAPPRLFGGETPRNDNISGRVARYAWGKDYHKVIGRRLEEFRARLQELAGRPIRAEICVDTKPLLERSLAQRAGLGFIGKQSQLLSPKFGPWLFLGELVTDLELEPDAPFIGDCGSCTICIDHCPTQAIRPEGGIDARRCIAYLTIEHKGEIPEPLRPLIGDWVFGCDLCLEVCPFTSKAKEARWPELKAESGFGPELDLAKLFDIPSNRAYEEKFKDTALLRARRKQLLRNARVVLENLTDASNPFKGGFQDAES